MLRIANSGFSAWACPHQHAQHIGEDSIEDPIDCQKESLMDSAPSSTPRESAPSPEQTAECSASESSDSENDSDGGGTTHDNEPDGSCLHNQPLGPGVSPLAKALHRAWAFHEYCSGVIDPALDFFEAALGKDQG